VIHCYKDLTVALMLNPIHANFTNPRAWEAEGEVLANDNGLKFGVASLTTIKEILPLPKITTEQRVRFGIFCALKVYKEPKFIEWANNWLSGVERSAEAAWAAEQAAERAAWAAGTAWAQFGLADIAKRAIS